MSLSHALNRFKLRFSPEKLDTMIIQAVGEATVSFLSPFLSPSCLILSVLCLSSLSPYCLLFAFFTVSFSLLFCLLFVSSLSPLVCPLPLFLSPFCLLFVSSLSYLFFFSGLFRTLYILFNLLYKCMSLLGFSSVYIYII